MPDGALGVSSLQVGLQLWHISAKTGAGQFWRMTEETYKKLKPMLDQLWGYVLKAAGFDGYQAGFSALQEQGQRNSSFGNVVQDFAQQVYPEISGNSIDPEKFAAILGLIDTPEKAEAVFRSLPEEQAPELEKFLRWFLKEWLPSQRAYAQSMAKHLPQRRAGGAPSTIPSDEECRDICNEISSLHRKGVSLGLAQRRLARKRALSLRTVQRIWAQRRLNTRKDLRGENGGKQW